MRTKSLDEHIEILNKKLELEKEKVITRKNTPFSNVDYKSEQYTKRENIEALEEKNQSLKNRINKLNRRKNECIT